MKHIAHTLQNLLYFSLLLCFSACHSHSKKTTILEYEGKFPDESAKNIEYIMSENGQIAFVLNAPMMNTYYGDRSYNDFPEGITVSSYTNGEKHSTLTANYAIREDFSERMEARGNVVIVDLVKHESIYTEKIIWDQKHKRIFSDVEVTQIKADGTKNMGDGFEADEKFTKYTIRNSRGEFLAEEL